MGGLFDKAILGQGEQIMGFGMVGWGEGMVHRTLHENHKRDIRAWQERALAVMSGNLGYVSGALLHHWHGTAFDRKYPQRPAILTPDVYDPDIDLIRDASGLYRLRPDNLKLREITRVYNRQRRAHD